MLVWVSKVSPAAEESLMSVFSLGAYTTWKMMTLQKMLGSTDNLKCNIRHLQDVHFNPLRDNWNLTESNTRL